MSSEKSAVNRAVEHVADLLIKWRKSLLALFVLLTLALGYSATHTQLDPGFNKQIPVRKPPSSRITARARLPTR